MLQRVLAYLTQTLRGFVFSSTMVVAVLAFTGAALSATLLYEHLLDQRARDTSAQITRQTYLAVQDALRQPDGHREAQRLIDTFRLVFPQNLSAIRIQGVGSNTAAELQAQGVVVEALGMQNEIPSPKDGKVVEIAVGVGQVVEGGATLATVE